MILKDGQNQPYDAELTPREREFLIRLCVPKIFVNHDADYIRTETWETAGGVFSIKTLKKIKA